MEQRSHNQDRELVEKCLTGSEQAWQEFYARFVGLMKSVVRKWVDLGPQDVQDITQLAFLELTTALNNYDFQQSLPRFVCVITQRVLIDEYRKAKAAKRDGLTESTDCLGDGQEGQVTIPSELPAPDELVERAELVSQLKSALKTLDPRCRELITSRFYKGLSFGEIADSIGATENTVTVQTRRCLGKLKAAFGDLERRGQLR